jgi:hypothetical protein
MYAWKGIIPDGGEHPIAVAGADNAAFTTNCCCCAVTMRYLQLDSGHGVVVCWMLLRLSTPASTMSSHWFFLLVPLHCRCKRGPWVG